MYSCRLTVTVTVVVFSPSSSSVSVSANIIGALFSPRSPPVAKIRFSSALEASCVRKCEEQSDREEK